ncbi:MAG: response regulator [Epsilonproteobacteria bacterium]|nr:response regulator [Campylobacterota bacterium]
MKKLTILYVEDEERLIESYAPFLEGHCETLHVARDGEEAYDLYKEHRPNIILLDIYTPKMNGIELAKKIREDDYSTILIAFTGHSDQKTLLELVDLYFLSYLIKPVSRTKLVEALVKASEKIEGAKQVHLPHNCSWDARSKTLFHGDQQISLTKRESYFFDLLVKKKGIPSNEDEILFHVWGDKFDKTIANTSIRTLVKNLRKKLPDGLVKNQYGLGYKIDL